MTYRGVTFGLFGDSGSGKTTQAGEWAKHVKKTRGKSAVLHSSDLGGFDSLGPLIRKGVVKPVELEPKSDPWIWINDAVEGKHLTADDGYAIFDGGTSMSEALMTACHESPFQIGQQKTQKFTVSRGAGQDSLTVGINNEAHYGVVQGYMLDAIWRSMWLTRRGVDVLWTFGVLRSEEQDHTPILGPKLAGRALTPSVPKWFRYFFRLVSQPRTEAAPLHRLYLAEYPELAGLGHSFGNARFPLDGGELPPYVEPASLVKAMELIEEGQRRADEALDAELGV